VGIRQSAVVTVVLGTIEITILLVLGLVLIVKAGANQPLVAFTPSASPQSWGGVGFAMVFGILSFLGFESGIPLSEESNNAKRSLSITILASTIGAGIYFCFLGYATVAGWGFTDSQSFAADFSGATNPYFTLAGNAFGVIGPWLILFAVANSAFGGGITAYNAITRVYYSLGRSRVFPRWFGHVNPSTQTPDNAILFQGALAVACALGLGFAFGTANAWGLLGIVWTIAVTIVYMMSNLSCIVLYWTKFRDEFSVLKHLIIPVLGILVFIPALISGLAPQLLFGYTNDYPFSLALPIVVVWAVIGLALYFYLRASGRERLDAMANEMAHVELAGEEFDPRSRATLG
jgi:amino acid transporter